MNKAISLLTLVLISSFSFTCDKFQRDVVIPRSKIQETVDKKFPYEKNIVIARMSLDSPFVYFKDENIGMRLNYYGNFLNNEVKGLVDFLGRIIYKQEEGAFYLSDLDIVEITVNETNYSDQEELKAAVSNIASNYLIDFPIYRLNQKDFKQSLAKLLIKDVKVKGDALVVTMGI